MSKKHKHNSWNGAPHNQPASLQSKKVDSPLERVEGVEPTAPVNPQIFDRPDLNGLIEVEIFEVDSSLVIEDINIAARHRAFKQMLGLKEDVPTISKASPVKKL